MQAHLAQALQASHEVELELRARELRLQVSLEAANVGTWDWDIRRGEVRWSETLERIHGQTPGGFRGTFEGFLDGVHPEDRQRVLDTIQRALAGGEVYEVEYRSLGPDGSVRWFEGRGHVIRDQAGEAAWMSGICMDATERHRMQDQLRQSQRLESLGLLAGGIAHDFNNLLAGVMGNASLALTSLPPASAAAPLIEKSLAACERAAQLTRRLLAYAGKEQAGAALTSLTALVRDVGSLVSNNFPERIDLVLDLEEGLPPVLADEAQLHQIVMNLVINAAEAIPEGATGSVTVATRRRKLVADDHHLAVFPIENPVEEYVALSVRDTGSGMDAATQARIFDPFYTTKFTGRGLGLSAVLGIVGGHRGAITLESAPGAGSCFTVLLPAVCGNAGLEGGRRERPVKRGSGTILVVDDEPAVRELAQCTLEGNGYHVLPAGDGMEAIRLVAEHPEIRAVLLDITMPAMAGDVAASRIRALRPGLPILLSSGYADGANDEAGGDAVHSAFLEKPYQPRLLLEKMERLIEPEGS